MSVAPPLTAPPRTALIYNQPLMLIQPETGQYFYATPIGGGYRGDVSSWLQLAIVAFLLTYFFCWYFRPTWVHKSDATLNYQRILFASVICAAIVFLLPFLYRLFYY
jgi:hypothetical protein